MPGDVHDTQPNEGASPRRVLEDYSDADTGSSGYTERSDDGDADSPARLIDLSSGDGIDLGSGDGIDLGSGDGIDLGGGDGLDLGGGDGAAPTADGEPADGAAGTGGADGADGTDIGTRDRIVQAAADVFLQKGFTGTRVVDIARRAGFTSGALYGYFDSRAELLAEAVARGSSQMLSRLLGADPVGDATETRARDAGSEDPLSVLESALAQIASPIDESGQMLLDGIALAHREPVAGDRLAQTVDQFRWQLANEDSGGLGKDAADMLVVLVLGITAARALGWHDPPSEAMRQHISDCLTRASHPAAD